MSWFRSDKARPTLDGLYDSYAAKLEAGPEGFKTLHPISELPADKPLMKAVLLAKAFEYGTEANDILKAGYTCLANFQDDTAEPVGRHGKIANEMIELGLEWDMRVRFPAEARNA